MESWGDYGFPHTAVGIGQKSWGILELENLTKASIVGLCSSCNSKYRFGKCTLKYCKSTAPHIPVAAANLQVSGIDGLISVKIKDDLVRIYLGIENDIWNKLCKLAGQQEVLYLIGAPVAFQNENNSSLHYVFTTYCEILRPRRQCFISVRRLKTFTGTLPVYFCTHLEPLINPVMSQLATDLNCKLRALFT